MKVERATFLAMVAALAACPSPRAPEIAPGADASPNAVKTSGFRDDAPDDPYPIDLRAFPSPAHESWGVFRPDVQCGFQGESKDYVHYDKQGAACWGFWKCEGSDDVAKPVDCAAIAKQSGCTAEDPDGMTSARILREECARNLLTLKPRIAARAAQCMQQETDYACQRQITDACREHALYRACPDASIDSTCDLIVKACPSAPRDLCAPLLSGLLPDARAKVAACMKFKVNCDAGLVSCVDRLGQFD